MHGKLICANIKATVGCRVVFYGAHGYEIGDGDDRHTMCLQKCICICRAWELSGIPALMPFVHFSTTILIR